MIPVHLLHGVLLTESVTVRTFAASTSNGYGEVIDGAATDVVETMPIHPASGKMLDRLPDADKQRETLACYPLAGTALARVAGSRPPRLQRNGFWYEVTDDQDYATIGGVRIVLITKLESTS
jgi:hypothetical protein